MLQDERQKMPGTADRDAGARRKPREPPEHSHPTPSAQAVTGQVSAQRRAHGDDNARAQAEVPAPSQRAGVEQSGDHRYRKAALVAEDPHNSSHSGCSRSTGDYPRRTMLTV